MTDDHSPAECEDEPSPAVQRAAAYFWQKADEYDREKLQGMYNDLHSLQDQTETVPLSMALDVADLALQLVDRCTPNALPTSHSQPEIANAIASIPSDLNWLIGKGKTRPDEPPYGVQLLRGLEVVAEAESDDLCIAIRDAIGRLA